MSVARKTPYSDKSELHCLLLEGSDNMVFVLGLAMLGTFTPSRFEQILQPFDCF
jgi:hypothetical protein